MDLAIKTFGSLDILINDVGVGNYKNIIDTSAAEYDEMMDSNMRSTFLFTRHTVPVIIKQDSGTILMISSMVGVATGTANTLTIGARQFKLEDYQRLQSQVHTTRVATS